MPVSYHRTKTACYMGYITQAIINNLSPLLFLTFQQEFNISLAQISLIITVNFFIQIFVDLLSAKFVDKIGYRKCAVAAECLCVIGLSGLSLLPFVLPVYPALLLATAFNAVGGGILEVLVSPIIEALPTQRKESEMSLLHSFYCWGHVCVVLLSTAFFTLFGIKNWRILPLLWAILPLIDAFEFMRVPLCPIANGKSTLSIRKLFSTPAFGLFLLLMMCAGASEQAMSQWASFFAETGLKVSKTVGDLLGPCLFAALMGLARVLFGANKHLNIRTALMGSSCLCVICYVVTIFSPDPLVSLLGCGLCGFSVGILWPGVFSMAAAFLPGGGTALFAFLALAGDIGCCVGPTLVGAVSDGIQATGKSVLCELFPWMPLTQQALKTGFFLALLFPVLLISGLIAFNKLKHGS